MLVVFLAKDRTGEDSLIRKEEAEAGLPDLEQPGRRPSPRPQGETQSPLLAFTEGMVLPCRSEPLKTL